MMLSVLIVNYNVCYFLEQCLLSVLDATRHLQAAEPGWGTEVLVFDNASNDGSVGYLEAKFNPAGKTGHSGKQISIISSPVNLGFAKANNQLLKLAKGKYVLYLNPDTLLPASCLLTHLRFAEGHQNFGASGIRMVDGTGRFLPESKRGFPGPWASFTKMTGLAAAFPASAFFAGYYVGHFDALTTREVPVLSGAYMLAATSVVQSLDGFDEQFFMYAEDIDLSYRITKSGYRNFYFADETIVHFKGESTSRDSGYVKQFYRAMLQFVRKHYPGTAAPKRWGLELGIRGGAALAAVRNFVYPAREKQARPTSSKTFYAGDRVAINFLATKFDQQQFNGNRTITTKPGEATELIFCTGDAYPIKEAITQLQHQPVSETKKFFRIEAGAVIGSDSSKRQGTVERI